MGQTYDAIGISEAAFEAIQKGVQEGTISSIQDITALIHDDIKSNYFGNADTATLYEGHSGTFFDRNPNYENEKSINVDDFINQFINDNFSSLITEVSSQI